MRCSTTIDASPTCDWRARSTSLPATLRGSSRAVAAARACGGLHHALLDGLDVVLRELPGRAGSAVHLRHLTQLARLAAEWVPALPAPHLSVLARDAQSISAHDVTTGLFALTLGAACGSVDVDMLADLILAGLLADAGKASMPESIWQKAGPLSGEEWEMMRRHPERSFALLQHAGVRSVRILRAVRWHHDRWGGTGYPDRLQGEFIPIEARIVGIADAFAALTVDRVFSSARGGYDALVEMARSEGQFDPALLRIFVTTIGSILPARERWGAA